MREALISTVGSSRLTLSAFLLIPALLRAAVGVSIQAGNSPMEDSHLTYTLIHKDIQTPTQTHTCTHARTHACTHIHTHTHTRGHIHTHTDILHWKIMKPCSSGVTFHRPSPDFKADILMFFYAFLLSFSRLQL